MSNMGPRTSGNSTFVSRDSELILWHCRLGHPSLPYLKRVFPSQCESCELAKYQRTSFPYSIYKSSSTFAMIHNDMGTFLHP